MTKPSTPGARLKPWAGIPQESSIKKSLKVVWWSSLFLAVILSGPACKRKKNLTPALAPETTQSINNTSTAIQPSLTLLSKGQAIFEGYAGKAKVKYQDKGQSVSANLSYKGNRGQGLTFNVTVMFGIPVAQGIVRADSFFVHNKLQNQLLVGETTRLQAYTGLPADLSTLEGVLTTLLAIPKNFRFSQASDSSFTAVTDNGDEFTATYPLSEPYVQQLRIRQPGNGEVQLANSHPEGVDGLSLNLPSTTKLVALGADVALKPAY